MLCYGSIAPGDPNARPSGPPAPGEYNQTSSYQPLSRTSMVMVRMRELEPSDVLCGSGGFGCDPLRIAYSVIGG